MLWNWRHHRPRRQCIFHIRLLTSMLQSIRYISSLAIQRSTVNTLKRKLMWNFMVTWLIGVWIMQKAVLVSIYTWWELSYCELARTVFNNRPTLLALCFYILSLFLSVYFISFYQYIRCTKFYRVNRIWSQVSRSCTNPSCYTPGSENMTGPHALQCNTSALCMP